MLLKVARFGIAKYKLELPNPKLSGGVSVDRRTLFDTITFFIRAIVYENSAPWQKIGETEVKDAIWEMSAFACVAQENEVDFEIMREINYGLDPSSEAVGYTNWKSHEKAAQCSGVFPIVGSVLGFVRLLRSRGADGEQIAAL